MWMAWTILAGAALAQQPPVAGELVPYQFTFTNGDPILYAKVNEADLDRVSIPVLIDEPWNKRAYSITLQRSFIDDMSAELTATRRDRLRREWEAAGGVEIRDRGGNPYWVLQADLEKHNRAEAMVDGAFPSTVDAEPLNPSAAEGLQEGSASGPGFARLWGPHVAIVTGAVALMGLAVWLTFRRNWSPV